MTIDLQAIEQRDTRTLKNGLFADLSEIATREAIQDRHALIAEVKKLKDALEIESTDMRTQTQIMIASEDRLESDLKRKDEALKQIERKAENALLFPMEALDQIRTIAQNALKSSEVQE